MVPPPTAKPRLRHTLTEGLRFARGLSTLPGAALRQRQATAAGVTRSPVLVLPGFMTGDPSTMAIRRYLDGEGFESFGWELGRNRGNVEKLVPRALERLDALHHQRDTPLALVGWSLGGVIARELARARPELVRHVVTMGTPLQGGPKYTLAASHYERRGLDLDAYAAQIDARNTMPLPVPVTAIYSRRDGVVAWQACIDPNPNNQVQHIEVRAGHAELGFSAPVLAEVVRALGA